MHSETPYFQWSQKNIKKNHLVTYCVPVTYKLISIIFHFSHCHSKYYSVVCGVETIGIVLYHTESARVAEAVTLDYLAYYICLHNDSDAMRQSQTNVISGQTIINLLLAE
jgi:hypothetical protein